MFLKKIFVFVLCLVVICESTFVDTLHKCSKDDGECQKKLIQEVIRYISENGVQELGIPVMDPARLDNLTVSILNVLEITFNGTVKGIKNCELNEFTSNIDDGVATLNITCSLVIKGKYSLFSTGNLLKDLFRGQSLHGNGDGRVKVEKFNIIVFVPFELKKRGDDIFLIGKKKKLTYTFNFGNLNFKASNLYLGETESSAIIVKLINENWKPLVQSYGKKVVDIAINYVYKFIHKFFTNVPTRYYFIEDLSSYVTDE